LKIEVTQLQTPE